MVCHQGNDVLPQDEISSLRNVHHELSAAMLTCIYSYYIRCIRTPSQPQSRRRRGGQSGCPPLDRVPIVTGSTGGRATLQGTLECQVRNCGQSSGGGHQPEEYSGTVIHAVHCPRNSTHGDGHGGHLTGRVPVPKPGNLEGYASGPHRGRSNP